MSSLVGKGGSLNTTMIQKELVTALAEDHNYKITDEAKKKHISTASSYDEFKNFVACADQKRVSNAEMESLSKPEKGWKSKTNLALGQTGKLPKNKSKSKSENMINSKFPIIAPKTPMEFDREWRRHCSTPMLKLKLLLLCGSESLLSIFKTEIDVGLLGAIIKCFDDVLKSTNGNKNDEQNDKNNLNFKVEKDNKDVIKDDIDDETFILPENVHELIFDMMKVIPKTGRFKLNVQFLEEKDKENVKSILQLIQHKRTSSSSSYDQKSCAAEEDHHDDKVNEKEEEVDVSDIEKLMSQFKL
jgi:hypothetical protein